MDKHIKVVNESSLKFIKANLDVRYYLSIIIANSLVLDYKPYLNET